jgi:YidC/Oxa1 family membrane protein insertase
MSVVLLDNALGQLWHPVWYVWWQVFGAPMRAILAWLVHGLSGNGLADSVGPFGVAILLLTILIKFVLSPIFQYQLQTSRRVQAEQRKIAPEMAALRKKYKKDPQKLNQETMALYRKHGINPLSQMSGCLPAVLQAPILIALYWVIYGVAKGALGIHDLHFLWIPHLDQRAGLPTNGFYILPILAGVTTFIQTKMMTPTGQVADPTQQAMTQNMTLIMPVFIAFISLNFPAALALYWVISNLFSIGQQYFITGWGSLNLPRLNLKGATS